MLTITAKQQPVRGCFIITNTLYLILSWAGPTSESHPLACDCSHSKIFLHLMNLPKKYRLKVALHKWNIVFFRLNSFMHWVSFEFLFVGDWILLYLIYIAFMNCININGTFFFKEKSESRFYRSYIREVCEVIRKKKN